MAGISICWGDYRVSKPILLSNGLYEDEYFDIFHVLMELGGYCDCEILYNVAPDSELAQRYWEDRRTGSHHGPTGPRLR